MQNGGSFLNPLISVGNGRDDLVRFIVVLVGYEEIEVSMCIEIKGGIPPNRRILLGFLVETERKLEWLEFPKYHVSCDNKLLGGAFDDSRWLSRGVESSNVNINQNVGTVFGTARH